MNTLPAEVRPAKIACTSWLQDRRAIRLLASCAKNPPKGRYVTTVYVTSADSHFVYSGYRAEALAVIRAQHGERLLVEADRTGDYTAMDAHCASPTVTSAIDAAGLAVIYDNAALGLRKVLLATAAAPFMAEAA